MTKHSARAQWNTANAQLANKPFDDLFTYNKPKQTDEQPTDYIAETQEAMTLLKGEPCIHTIHHPYELPGGVLYRMFQLDKEEDAKRIPFAEAWMMVSLIIEAVYLYVPVKVIEEAAP